MSHSHASSAPVPQPSVGPVPEPPGPEWQRNTSLRPEGSLRRVRVLLRKGEEPQYADALNPMAPPGWNAETTRWSLTGSPFDVVWYLPI